MRNERIASEFQVNRPALVSFAARMVLREEVAEELVQQAAVRALEQGEVPEAAGELRAWFFRVVTNLAIDHLRRHSTRHEDLLGETRRRAEGSPEFMAASAALAGTGETRSIAREHLSVCFSCTLHNLGPEESAALLLKEVHGFTVEEVARALDASFGQAKGWIQAARAKLTARYASSCALVAQKGPCFQCVELDHVLGANQGDPLAGTDGGLDARLSVVRARGEAPLGPWHRRMMGIVDEVLGHGPEARGATPKGPPGGGLL